MTIALDSVTTVPSWEFLGFAALAAVLINVSNKGSWRRAILLAANVAFFALLAHDPRQLLPFACLVALGFLVVKILQVFRNRAAFVIALVILILAFVVLKQYTFVPNRLLLSFVYTTIGMSYVFFRILHLAIDAYEDALPDRVDPVSYVNYTLNFTSLVSGPIQLYTDYRQYESAFPATLEPPIAARALERIIAGFFKVAVVSPVLFDGMQHYLAMLPAPHGLLESAVYCALVITIFPVFVYVNFSGYMDFVIGVARFLRIVLPENFERPFTSAGYIEFWNRWHITLSNWLKIYVYMPLVLALLRRAGRSADAAIAVFVYFVTFFLVGAWHGPTSNFLFFGVLQGLGVSLNKLYEIVLIRRLGRKAYFDLSARLWHKSLARGLTFTWFAFSMLWFWSNSAQLSRLASQVGTGAVVLSLIGVFAGASLLLALLSNFSRKWTVRTPYLRTAWNTALVFVVISVTIILNAPAPQVVYKAF